MQWLMTLVHVAFKTCTPSPVVYGVYLSHHLYADDSQVYISLSQSNAHEFVSTLNDCLTDILFWMESNKLKLILTSTFASIFLEYVNFYHIRDLRRIRRHISISTAKTISMAFISSRLDYCNSLINNIAKKDLAKLQRVKNFLARVVRRAPRFSPSLPLLKQLHWLPVFPITTTT